LTPAEIQPSGEDYLRATNFRGIDHEVVYYDPTAPAPALETQQALPPDLSVDIDGRDVVNAWETGRILTLFLTGLVIFGLVYLFIRFGGRLPLSFARNPENAGNPAKGPIGRPAGEAASPMGIKAIIAMKDRREALVALCKALLAKAITAEGVLLQDSWTDRDTLRRVPRAFPYRDALQNLVFASERVQFGGRDVTEEDFHAHVKALAPMWTGRTR